MDVREDRLDIMEPYIEVIEKRKRLEMEKVYKDRSKVDVTINIGSSTKLAPSVILLSQ